MGLTQRMAPDRRVWLCGEVAEVVFSGVPDTHRIFAVVFPFIIPNCRVKYNHSD